MKRREEVRSSSPGQDRYSRSLSPVDFAAMICFAALACYLFIAVRYGIGVVDEGFYLTIPHRLLFGDSLLTDEWHLSQLSSFFQMLPVKLFVTFTGGTEGIILFMRCFFVVCWLAVFIFAYVTLRRFGVAALIGTLLPAFTVPVDIPAFNYYSGLIMFSVLLCCVLFWREKKEVRPAELVLSGVLLSCMVLNDPLDALLYFLFSAAVLTALLLKRRQKSFGGKLSYLLELKTWLFITAGILISMAVVFGFILTRTDLNSVLEILPELFTDSEYSLGVAGDSLATADKSSIFSMSLLVSEIKAMGTVRTLLFCLICAAGVYFRKRSRTVRTVLLAAAAFLTIFMSISFYKGDPDNINQITCINFPKVFFGVMLLVFTEKHDPRLTFSVVLVFLASALRDISSDITLGITVNACIPVFAVYCSKLISELTAPQPKAPEEAEDKKKSAGKLLRPAGISVLAAAVLVTGTVSALSSARMGTLFEKTFFYVSSDTSRATLDRGPLKGIHTKGKLANTYGLITDDLEKINRNCSGHVYVSALNSWYYLCLDKPYGTYSAWFVEEDSTTRQLHYWELYPEKRPEYIYIPKVDCYSFKSNRAAAKARLSFLSSLCECETEESLVGITVHILSWK